MAFLALLGTVLSSAPAAAQPMLTPPDRYGTAAAAAFEAFPAGADVAILASGENFPDALAAAPLAAFYDALILLTGRSTIPPVTSGALVELGVAAVIVLGGPATVSLAVSNELELNYQVSRVAGTDHYGTAAQAALDAFPAGATVAILASGENFPDALSAAPLAAFYDALILLTGRSTIPPATAAALADLGVSDVIVMGGPAVSFAVTNALELDYGVTRVAGGSGATRTVQVFFANTSLGAKCDDVIPVQRTVEAAAPLRPALEALLAGPTPAEQALGYGGWFSSATEGTLNDVGITSRVAFADFDDLRSIIPNASTACGSAGLLAQLDSTATQLDTVDDARFSLLGSEVVFYEWLRMTPPT